MRRLAITARTAAVDAVVVEAVVAEARSATVVVVAGRVWASDGAVVAVVEPEVVEPAVAAAVG